MSSLDRAFDALADEYRCHLLVALYEENPQSDTDTDPLNCAAKSPAERERRVTQTALIHTHLPKLEASGFIEWDRDAGEISTGPRWDEIEPLLRLLREHADELPVAPLPPA